MNIAYKGKFLREGLLENGHQLFDLNLKKGQKLDEALKDFPDPVDLVLWEFYGAFSNIMSFSQCEAPVAAYCVDTPLNEFWLRHCMQNMDYVFVDQPQCLDTLREYNIKAAWLPLAAPKSWFQPKREKIHDITFIGTIDAFRAKRKNLLNLLQKKFGINIMSGLSVPATQKIFSESKIIINENFFPGLIMRVLQGLSAGTIVMTEQSPYGHSFGLKDGQDLICYNADNILERIADLLEHYDSYADMGMEGQKKCRELYSCESVAANLVSTIYEGGLGKKSRDKEAWLWEQSLSELLFAQRYGGNFSEPMRRLKFIAANSMEKAWLAHALIGDIQARFKDAKSASTHYLQSLAMRQGSIAGLKLALLHIHRNDPGMAKKFIEEWMRHSPSQLTEDVFASVDPKLSMKQRLLAAIGEIYFSMGRLWDMGFRKNFADPVPDTALDVAKMAWAESPCSWALTMMNRCLRPYHLQGEALPYMLAGIKTGLLSDSQILETARQAFEYYDHDLAATIISALRKCKK